MEKTEGVVNRLRRFEATGPLAYYRNQVEIINKENKRLKKRLENLEQENHDLKKSVYDISIKYDVARRRFGDQAPIFDINEALRLGEDLGETEIDNSDIMGFSSGVSSFHCKSTFTGHEGAVYCAKFSNNGQLLATTSIDSTIRLWNPSNNDPKIAILKGHKSLVIDASWSKNNDYICSAGFDRTVKLWNVEHQKIIAEYGLSSFAQCVQIHQQDSQLIYCSAARGKLTLWDYRTPSSTSGSAVAGITSQQTNVLDNRDGANNSDLQSQTNPDANSTVAPEGVIGDSEAGALTSKSLHSAIGALKPLPHGSSDYSKPVAEISNDEGISSFLLFREGMVILTADRGGKLRSWDIRKPSAFIEEIAASSSPLTHISISPPFQDDLRSVQYLAVNAYDSILRVYDGIQEIPSLSSLSLVHALTGHRNRNYPIKSSFCSIPSRLPSISASTPTHPSLLLATGSNDTVALVFDASPPSSSTQAEEEKDPKPLNASVDTGTEEKLKSQSTQDDSLLERQVTGHNLGDGSLLQRLLGHRGRVYSATFHPFFPFLVTAGGDGAVRLWKPSSSYMSTEEDDELDAAL